MHSTEGSTVVYYHADALGSTRLETSASGTVLFMDSYQPYGQENGTPTGTDTYKFTGKPYSIPTGLYYYGARWYDPSVGRFISQDPLAGHLSNPQSLNLYIYVEDSPTNSIDPTGMADCGWNPLSWGGCLENAGGAIENGWNGLPTWAKVGIIVGVIAVIAVGTGGFGLLAAPEIAGGLGGTEVASAIGIGAGAGLGGLSVGALETGALATLGLGLGIVGLDELLGVGTTGPGPVTTEPGTGGPGLPRTGDNFPSSSQVVSRGSLIGTGTNIGTTNSFSPESQANVYGTIAKAVRAARNNPYLRGLCAAGAIIGGGGLFVFESVESAKQGGEAPDPEGIINGALAGCLVGLGTAAVIPH